MALPQITNNSPVGGSIAWTATGIVYAGTNYTIAAGSSSKKFVWWEYNNGAPVLRDGDTLPELGIDDVLLFLNKSGVGALVPTMEVVDGSLLVSGSVLAASIAADQIQTYHLQSKAITTDKLDAGAVTATEVAAGAITTDKLAVGSVGDNLVTNGSFEEFAGGMPVGWQADGAPKFGSIDVVSGVASSGAYAARLVCTSASSDVRLIQDPSKFIPVSAASGRKWYLSARVGAGTATSKGFYLRANWYDANRVKINSSDAAGNAAVTTSFAVFEGQVTPPATARYLGISILMVAPSAATNIYVDEITAREVIVAAVIGDGQITTPKLVANAVTAEKVAANAITADKIMVGDMTNMVADGNFVDTTKANWSGNGTVVTSSTEPNRLKVVTAASGNNDQSNRNRFNAVPGEQYFGQAWVYGETTNVGGGGPNLHMTVRQENGSTSWPYFQTKARAAVQGKWELLSGVVTIPANGATAIIEPGVGFSADAVGNIYYFRQISVRRLSGGELIVDGAITTDKLGANAVTASKILAGSIQANHLAADSIDGKVITGPTIQSNPEANRGLKWTDAGLKAYDTTGVERFAVDSTTGNVSARGQISSYDGTNIAALTMISDQFGALRPGMSFGYDTGTHDPPVLFGASNNESTPSNNYAMYVGSGRKRVGGTRAQLTLQDGGEWSLVGAGEGALNGGGVSLVDDRASTVRTKGRNIVIQADNVITNGSIESSGVTTSNPPVFPYEYAEFTGTTGIPSGAQWGSGPLTKNTGRSLNAGFVNAGSSDRLVFSKAGVYQISCVIDTGSVSASGAAVILFDASSALITGGGKQGGSGVIPLNTTVFINAGEALRWRFDQASGVIQSWFTTIRVYRMK